MILKHAHPQENLSTFFYLIILHLVRVTWYQKLDTFLSLAI